MDERSSDRRKETADEIVARTVRETMRELVEGSTDPVISGLDLENDPVFRLIRQSRWRLLKAYVGKSRSLCLMVIFGTSEGRPRRIVARLRYAFAYPWDSVANIVATAMILGVIGAHPAIASEKPMPVPTTIVALAQSVQAAGEGLRGAVVSAPALAHARPSGSSTSPSSYEQPGVTQLSFDLTRDERRVRLDDKVTGWLGQNGADLTEGTALYWYCDTPTKKKVCDTYEAIP
jgi:hypothetical protein